VSEVQVAHPAQRKSREARIDVVSQALPDCVGRRDEEIGGELASPLSLTARDGAYSAPCTRY
jgi:hypothetical protein